MLRVCLENHDFCNQPSAKTLKLIMKKQPAVGVYLLKNDCETCWSIINVWYHGDKRKCYNLPNGEMIILLIKSIGTCNQGLITESFPSKDGIGILKSVQLLYKV